MVVSPNNGYELSSSDSMDHELEDGEVMQGAEIICVGQEDMDRLAAEGRHSSSQHLFGKLSSLFVVCYRKCCCRVFF